MPDEPAPIEFATFGEERDIDQALADAAASGNVAAIALFDRRAAIKHAAESEKARELATRAIVESADPDAKRREGRAFDYAHDRTLVNEAAHRGRWIKNLDRLDRLMDQAEADTEAARKWAHPVEMAELSQALVRTGAAVCARMEPAAQSAPAVQNNLQVNVQNGIDLSKLTPEQLRALAGDDNANPRT